MTVCCSRCKLEGERFEKGFKFSPLIHLWLCDECFDLLTDQFELFKEFFLRFDK
jgi:hypothetical protein